MGVEGGLARCMVAEWAEDEGECEGGVGGIRSRFETGNKALWLDEIEVDEVRGKVNVGVICDGAELHLEDGAE